MIQKSSIKNEMEKLRRILECMIQSDLEMDNETIIFTSEKLDRLIIQYMLET